MSIFQHVFGRRLGSFFSFSAFSFLALLLFFSCSGLFDGIKTNPASSNNNPARTGSGKIVTVRGTIHSSFTDGGALPEEYAGSVSASRVGDESRSALPEIPETGITYDVTATTIGSTPELTVDNGQVADGVVSIGLVTGHRWSVTVTMKQTSGGVTREILTDTYTMEENTTLTDELPLPEFDFYLKPLEYEESGGGGFISLQMTGGGTGESAVYNNVAIVSVTKNGIDVTNDWSGGNWSGSSSKLNVQSSLIATKTGVTITPGVYEVTLHFTKGNLLVYYTTQSITVFKNMTTSRWVSGGGSNSPISSSGTFEVTTALVNACTQNEFYVGSPVPGIEANDETGTGNPYKPFATVKRAVEFVNSLPNRDASQNPYIIRVKDGTTENVEQSITIGNNISIECWKNSLNDKAGTATLEKTANNIHTFEVVSGGSLTIDGEPAGNDIWSGLVIDGKEKTGGSGIYVNEGGTLTLNGGTIKNCKNYSGGGVHTSGTFTMTGGVIMTNESTNSSYSGGSEGGGGVLLYKGTFTMKDGVIRQNTAAIGGGGVLVYENTSFVMGDSVGNGTPKITNNTAAEGGGVFAFCNGFTMNRGSISNNISTTTAAREGGGGVFIDCRSSSAQFTMNGGKIEGNQTNSNGGGVCFDKSSSDSNIQFIMTGGIINNNKAENGKGGGVYLERSNMCMYGTAVIGDSTDRDSAATSISHSNIAKAGGGIASVQGNVYIGYSDANTPASSTGGIYYNYASGTGDSEGGGGIYYATKIANSNIKYNGTAGKGGGIYSGSCLMKNTEISGNSAVDGGGVFADNHNIVLSDGVVVSGNTATGNGNGVYVYGVKLGIKGSAYIQSSGSSANDVYLSGYRTQVGYGTIEISGALNPPAAAGGKVAKITPNAYTRTDVIVSVSGDSGYSNVSAVNSKFAVTPNEGMDYLVDSDGTLAEDPAIHATAENVSDVITEMTQSGMIKVSGALEEADFNSIKSALETLKNDQSDPEVKVKLDLSGVTGVTELPSGIFDHAYALEGLVLPEGLEKVDANCFWDCNKLKELYIPASVTNFTGLYRCEDLESVTIAPGNTSYYVDQDLKTVFSSDGKKIVLCFARNTIEEYNIPDAVEEIAKYAFDKTSFVYLKTSANSQLKTICDSAFDACDASEYISLPATLTAIGSDFCSYRTVTVKYRGTEAQWNAISYTPVSTANITMVYNYTGD